MPSRTSSVSEWTNPVDVQVSGVIESLGIGSWTRRIEVGTMDWTPDMLLCEPDVEEMLVWYRERGAERMQVSFTIALNPLPVDLIP
jgi:hypothetical protein